MVVPRRICAARLAVALLDPGACQSPMEPVVVLLRYHHASA
jgi:hypothetical protein